MYINKAMKKISPGPFLLGCLLFLPALFPLGALDLATNKIEDDSSLRLSLKESWFTEVPGLVLDKPGFTHTLPGGGRIQVRTETGKEEFMIILAREWNGSYPGWAQGSWILTRRRDNGAPSRIRIFLRSDPNTYIQFRPFEADKSQMDVVFYDAYAIRSLSVPFSFERLLVLPLEEVLLSLGAQFPRRYFDPNPDWYRDLRSFMDAVRQRLPELAFRDDGALDEAGRYVFINTLEAQDGTGGLNCSGFAKWVVDGILRPLTGTRLSIQPLKAPFGERGSSFTQPYETLRDPFFGLDWTRNLAAAAGGILRSPAFSRLEEFEVQTWPFSQVISRSRNGSALRSYPGFLKNAGFGIEGLQALLYTLAVDEPGWIYLASVNDEIDPAPRMRQHFHVAVLVPYFNEYGNFRIAVFESAAETSFVQFRNRYPGHYVNLVRIPAEPSFNP
jgi:hypothetical protein